MRFEKWRHPDLARGEKPSELETFVLLADAMARGDKAEYRSTQWPNTHWKNWPGGGEL